jgi:hypothetical protein
MLFVKEALRIFETKAKEVTGGNVQLHAENHFM